MDIGWLEITPGRQENWETLEPAFGQPAGDGWHAQFASLIRVRPMDQRAKRKWGFNLGALLDEAIERQRLFIQSRHFSGVPEMGDEPPERRTIALRAIHHPQAERLQLVLVAKVWGATLEAVRQAATDHWHEIHSTFPTDYELIPARSLESFYNLAGWRILQDAAQPNTIAEIQRYENVLNTGSDKMYLLGAWKYTNTSNEQTWRTLQGADRRILYNVTLRPTVLDELEQAALLVIAQYAEKIASQATLPNVKPYAEFAAKNYAYLLQQLRKPFIVQAQVVAPEGLPEYLPRNIGYAMTYRNDREPTTPGFQITRPANAAEVAAWRANLIWLEPEVATGPVIDPRFVRVRKMTDAYEARGLLCLPFPPDSELPDVHFAEKIEEPEVRSDGISRPETGGD